ncbi:Hypothetical predicted protein [Lecanosticta acicola]|uniref:Uncharacterized protein n=1 Tax=Lecanosticta acicola TaxID=111012 RepID=A0AAI9E7I1_9PEZI|nr:Hypothetical predicted protein [Lecanosticta acicola]
MVKSRKGMYSISGNYLLAEIIKAANPPPSMLFNLLRDNTIQPRWEDIPLPPGRSLNSCRYAFLEMQRSLSLQPMTTPMVPGSLTPTPLSLPPVTLKRPYQYEGGSYSAGAATGREIRPKPHASGISYSQPSPTEPPSKRKRGRPTKAEAQAKAELAAAAASAGDVGSVPVAVSAPMSMIAPSRPSTQTPAPIIAPSPAPSLPTTTQEPRPSQPASTSMPIAAMLTPNIREPKSASQSSSSSGKRRRARSTKSELEETPLARTGAEYESPYGRVRGGPEDSPARTAVLRHREDPSPRPPGEPEPGNEQQQQQH